MRLAELIDLESQLLRDEAALREGDGKKLLDRDRAIGDTVLKGKKLDPEDVRARLEVDPALRHDLTSGWLEQLRGKVPSLPGARMERGYRIVGLVLGLIAIAFGAVAASAALAYDGSTPVNVFGFLAGLVLVQVILLIAMILVVAFRRALGGSMVLGWAQALVVWMSRARWVDRMLRSLPEEGSAASAFKSRHHLYGGAERWLLFTLTQRFGLLFNASALATCLLLVTFTDLAFSWSTTLHLEPDEVCSTLDVIAAPWSWAIDGSVPDAEVVRRSQWVRRAGGKFIEGSTEADVKAWGSAWWRFLIAALCFWGLLPRLAAFLVGRWGTARSLARVTLDHAAFQRLYERLLPVEATWTGPAPDAVGDGGIAPEAAADPRPGAKRSRGSRARRHSAREAASPTTGSAVVLWGSLAGHGDDLAAVVSRRFSDDVTSRGRAGGADLADDAAAVAAIAGARVARVVLVVEAGVQPTKEVFGFVRDTRDGADARIQIVIGLVQASDGGWINADDAERSAWATRVEREGDPYLRFEDLVTAS